MKSQNYMYKVMLRLSKVTWTGVSWAKGMPKKLGSEPTQEQLQRCGLLHIPKQAVPNRRCGSSKGTSPAPLSSFFYIAVLPIFLHNIPCLNTPFSASSKCGSSGSLLQTSPSVTEEDRLFPSRDELVHCPAER